MQKLLEKLVAFKTITDDKDENQRALLWIESQLKKHLHTKILTKNSFSSLVATTRKTKKPHLWLAAHLDVVPGPTKLFKAQTKGSKLIGRGAYDMKFAIACYIKLVQDLKEKVKDYDFGIMITTDEETGGESGTGFLLKQGYTSKYAFLPDGGTSLMIERGAKGVWNIEVESKGKSTHSSRAWEGENAIDRLVDFIEDIKSHFPKEPCGDKTHYHNTISVGKIKGGEATNQVPAQATAHIDIRFIPEVGGRAIMQLVEKEARAHSITIIDSRFGNASHVDVKSPFVQTFKKLYKKMHNITLGTEFSHGSSDARFFAEYNIPTLLIQPKGAGHHTDNEWIDMKGLEKYYKVMKAWVMEIA